jgi:type IV pilus assembly protein PilF
MLGCLVALLSGCVTEVIGPNKSKVDLEKQLQAYIDLGVGYLGNGEYDRAKKNLNTALELNPSSAQAHNAMALLFQVEGEIKLAETHFKKAIAANPDLTQAQNNYGAFLFGEKRYNQAIKYLSSATEDRYYQHRAQVFENLGVCYLKIDDAAAAENAFTRATQLNPRQSRALLELAVIRFAEKSFVESSRYYRQHKASSSQSARSLLLCIKLAKVFNKPNEEASCSLTLRNIFPNTDQFLEYQNLAQ